MISDTQEPHYLQDPLHVMLTWKYVIVPLSSLDMNTRTASASALWEHLHQRCSGRTCYLTIAISNSVRSADEHSCSSITHILKKIANIWWYLLTGCGLWELSCVYAHGCWYIRYLLKHKGLKFWETIQAESYNRISLCKTVRRLENTLQEVTLWRLSPSCLWTWYLQI